MQKIMDNRSQITLKDGGLLFKNELAGVNGS